MPSNSGTDLLTSCVKDGRCSFDCNYKLAPVCCTMVIEAVPNSITKRVGLVHSFFYVHPLSSNDLGKQHAT